MSDLSPVQRDALAESRAEIAAHRKALRRELADLERAAWSMTTEAGQDILAARHCLRAADVHLGDTLRMLTAALGDREGVAGPIPPRP